MFHEHSGLRPDRARKGHRRSVKDRKAARPDRQKRIASYVKRVTPSSADSIILDYLERLGTPRALHVWMLYKAGQHRDLVELKFDPSLYELVFSRTGIHRLRSDYAASKFFSKCKNLKTLINKKEVALAAAREAEAQCSQTNKALSELASGRRVNDKLNTALFRASQIIARILGDCPASFEDVAFSGGRSTSAFGTEKSRVHKYTSQLDVYPQSLAIATRLVQDSPHWGQAALAADGPCSALPRAFELVKGNVMTVVPKNAKTDRVICYESHLNIRLQLAVGSYVRMRLLLNGVNLNDQSVNQRRARLGSKFGLLATLDLKAASDTVACELVRQLLPYDWLVVFDNLRAHYTKWPDGAWRKNEKFSSMGNGFTFELESLLFYAICSAVADNVSVYGDDIIVPTSSVEEVINILEGCGFTVNSAKSYWTGYFRESCGSDSVCGVEVTPVYLRVIPRLRNEVVKLHNAVRKWARGGYPERGWAEMLRAWRTSHSHHLGPASNRGVPLGDGHYHVNFDEACPQRAVDQVEGWWYKTTIPVFRKNSLYGDRVSGRFSGQFGPAALCAALGPKAVFDVYSNTVDLRQVKYIDTRGLSGFTWEDVLWV